MKKDKILDVLSIVLFFVFGILLIVFKNNYSVLLYTTSIIGFLVGIIFILKKASFGFLISSVAGSLFFSTLFYYQKILVFNDCLAFMICSSVALLMFFTIVFDFINKFCIKSKYSLKVVAKVVDLKINKNIKKECYAPVYEYEVDNKVYEIISPFYFYRNVPAIGDEFIIRVDPNSNEEVYFSKSFGEEFKEKFVAILLIIICVFIIIGLF